MSSKPQRKTDFGANARTADIAEREIAEARAAMRAQFEAPYDPAVDPPKDELEAWARIRRVAARRLFTDESPR